MNSFILASKIVEFIIENVYSRIHSDKLNSSRILKQIHKVKGNKTTS